MKIRWIRELFNFSRKERTGIISLLLIIFILIVIGKLIPFFVPSETTNFSKWEAEVGTYLANTEKGQLPVSVAFNHVAFNPNEVDSVTLVKMGVPSKVASNWVKYLEKGGKFRDKTGVKKIFGMTSGLFEQLDSFMVIPPVKLPDIKADNNTYGIKSQNGFKRDTVIRPTFSKREKVPSAVLELNSTDSLHLLEIPGIGPVFASRIIRYRNLLGGFYATEQLREVYGMREENFTAVSKYFTTDQSTLKTFNINFSTVQELGRHPYVGFRTARKVLKLRDKMGKFLSPDDLSTVVAVDSLKRLIPYLKFTQ